MKILALVGDHPRHKYITQKIADAEDLCGLVVEKREEHIPEPPERLESELSQLYEQHFEGRAAAEADFFGDVEFPDVPRLTVSRDELNSQEVRTFIQDRRPDITITYGVHILSNETLSVISGRAWNVHGGLSPEYRGVITHFWPSYMLEPQMTGVTLHELTSEVDAGPIVHQTDASLSRGDGIHELACRTVKQFGDELTAVLRKADEGELQGPVSQSRTGKLWTASDWRPEHLRLVYDVYDNDIVSRYLDGEFEQSEPDIFSQLD